MNIKKVLDWGKKYQICYSICEGLLRIHYVYLLRKVIKPPFSYVEEGRECADLLYSFLVLD